MHPPPAQSSVRLGQLMSVQVGRVQNLGTPGADEPLHRPWRSAFFKSPIAGAATVTALGIAGDEQADNKHHGGADKAVLMYSSDHFVDWRNNFSLEGLAAGGFGENLTVRGFADPQVCIGDHLGIGTTILEISQPREPCSNINRRWGRKGVTEAVAETGRGGWYARVLQVGTLEAGEEVVLLDRPFPALTVASANDAAYGRARVRAAVEALLACPALTGTFKRRLAARLAQLS